MWLGIDKFHHHFSWKVRETVSFGMKIDAFAVEIVLRIIIFS